MTLLENYHEVQGKIKKAAHDCARKTDGLSLVAVSKTHDGEYIRPVLEAGHRVFGENRVQEAQGKWPALKTEFPDVSLHCIGPLQTNKCDDAVALFDVIETVDREKLARKLKKAMDKAARYPQCFVQVNTGAEPQKAGIDPKRASEFVDYCIQDCGLNITGLMCIPPFDEEPAPHFALLRKLAQQKGLAHLSMGMSADYQIAIALGATHVRVGSAIFGARDYKALCD